MAKKKTAGTKPAEPKTFAGLIRGHSSKVKGIAKALREVVHEELHDVQESFYGGQRAMSMYRTNADVCWIQPLKDRCNIYFLRGPELNDPDGILEGTGKTQRHAKIRSLSDVDELPLRKWLNEVVALNDAATKQGPTFDYVLEKLQKFCLVLPNTKETLTWGKPHFRVGEKIFCGCGEDKGRTGIGLKMEPYQSRQMMKLPGIEKAPYSRKDDGWVRIDPGVFDDWEEIERFVIGSYRLIARKSEISQLDSQLSSTKKGNRGSKRK